VLAPQRKARHETHLCDHQAQQKCIEHATDEPASERGMPMFLNERSKPRLSIASPVRATHIVRGGGCGPEEEIALTSCRR